MARISCGARNHNFLRLSPSGKVDDALQRKIGVQPVKKRGFPPAGNAGRAVWPASGFFGCPDRIRTPGLMPLPFPRFFEKNRVKLLILRKFLCQFNASDDSYASAKLDFQQSQLPRGGSLLGMSSRFLHSISPAILRHRSASWPPGKAFVSFPTRSRSAL